MPSSPPTDLDSCDTTRLSRVLSFDICVCRSISLSILLWRDAAPPTCKFPSIEELTAIELTRILGEPTLFRAVPGLLSALRVGNILPLLSAPPWTIDPKELVQAYKATLTAEIRERTEEFIDATGHRDIVLDIIKHHRKKPTNTAATVTEITESVAKALGIDPQLTKTVLEDYENVYKSLARI